MLFSSTSLGGGGGGWGGKTAVWAGACGLIEFESVEDWENGLLLLLGRRVRELDRVVIVSADTPGEGRG